VTYSDADKRGRLRVIASPDGREGSVTVHQDAAVFATLLGPDEGVRYDLATGRHAWLQVARGAVIVNEEPLAQGDGAGITGERSVTIVGREPAELLLFDLA
jgi:redox-sensitive bicupin YhaK (pirin superfamily)